MRPRHPGPMSRYGYGDEEEGGLGEHLAEARAVEAHQEAKHAAREAEADLRRSCELIVRWWREHHTPHPDWPRDLPFALASEVLRLLDAEAKKIEVLTLAVGDYERRKGSRWGRFLLWLLRRTT